MNNVNWTLSSFEQLSSTQLYYILRARSEVFVVEQNCPYQDIDEADLKALHLVAWSDSTSVAAYLRMFQSGVKYAEASIGRVVTAKSHRGKGLGKELLVRAISELRTLGECSVRISAQQYLEKFYKSLGFKAVSDVYIEDNIPHLQMLLHL